MIEKIKQSKLGSYLTIILVYAIAFGVAACIFSLRQNGQEILYLFYADTAATIIVWLAGILFANSSIYDPYWSVVPILIITPMAYFYEVFTAPTLLTLLAVWFWGIRLTANWIYTFPNLTHQDWRYVHLKKENPKIWQLVNFFGIHYIPTLVVFLAMLPALYTIQLDVQATLFTYIGYAVCIGAVILQIVADAQIHRFKKEHTGKVCNTGLWKYSRHPNYLGEILFWWGIYFILLSIAPQYWWTGIGAVVNTLLFLFISIPLMEKRQLNNKPEYAEYAKQTSVLIPFKIKNKNNTI